MPKFIALEGARPLAMGIALPHADYHYRTNTVMAFIEHARKFIAERSDSPAAIA